MYLPQILGLKCDLRDLDLLLKSEVCHSTPSQKNRGQEFAKGNEIISSFVLNWGEKNSQLPSPCLQQR